MATDIVILQARDHYSQALPATRGIAVGQLRWTSGSGSRVGRS